MVSIRSRVLVGFTLVGVIPIVAIILATYTVIQSAIRTSEERSISNINDELARNVKVTMDRAFDDLASTVGSPLLAEKPLNVEAIQEEIHRLVNVYSHFDNISFYGTDAYLIATTERKSHVEAREHSQEFQIAVAGERAVTPPHKKRDSEELYLTVYLPVLGRSSVPSGIVKARISFDSVMSALSDAKIGKAGFAVLLDQFGNTISQLNGYEPMDKFDPSLGKNYWQDHRFGEYTDIRGKSYLFAASRLTKDQTKVQRPWTLVTFKPMSEVTEVLATSRDWMLAILSGTLVLAAILGYLVSRRIVDPIDQAGHVADSVAEDDLSVRMDEAAPSELARLARSFNKMIGEVSSHRQELESLVQDRTRSLRESQDQLSNLTAQLRASYDSTEEAILIVKNDGGVLTLNRRFAEIFRLNHSAEIDSTEIEEHLASYFDESMDFRDHWKLCNDSLSLIENEEWTTSHADKLTLSVYSAPVRNGSGVTIARLWMFRDITEQRQLETGLRQAQKMEAIGRLAGGIAHDFNNLLTGIIGNLSLVEMQKGDTEEQLKKLIGSAKHAGQRAAELVKQLLGFSRQSHLVLKSCQVNDIAEEVRDLLVHSIDPGISIVLELDEDLWHATADPNQVQQVIMNMAVNAKDAMGDRKGRIRISTSNQSVKEVDSLPDNGATPGKYVCISVEDTGSGMSAEVQSKIFEPFFTTKEQGKGTGLGLATSYGIIQQHGGWINCDSQLGVGTTFHIYLPQHELTEEEKLQEEVAEEPVKRGSETVLLVDDEMVVRMVGEGVLKHHGYDVLTAENGVEAIKMVNEHPNDIDIIMMDLTMPELSGRDTFKELRNGQYPQIPVLVCSGYLVDLAEFENETGSRPEGFVQKPYDSDKLARSLREVLDQETLALPS